jgi:hypothetical protein
MNRARLKFLLWTLAAFTTGLLLRLYFVLHLSRVAGDSLVYGNIARTWLQHGVYGFTEIGPSGIDQYRPTLIRLPGYPLFLAVCFRLFGMENYTAVLYVQLVSDLVTCWLAAALAGRLFGRHTFLPVLWIAALCPFTANYVALPLTETLVLTTIALAFYAFARWMDASHGFNRWLWIASTAIAYSILLRPDQGLLAAAILPAMLYRSLTAPARLCRKASRTARNTSPAMRKRHAHPLHSALPVFVATLCILLPLAPWTLRNQLTFHVFQPLAPYYANDPDEAHPLGFARWYRTWAIDFTTTETAYWNYPGDRIELSDLPSRAFDAGSPAATEDLYRRTAALLADYNRNSVATPALDARFDDLARERITTHPMLCRIALPVARLINMVLRPRTEAIPIDDKWWQWRDHPRESTFALAFAALNLVLFALALIGLARWLRRIWLSPADSVRRNNCALAFSMIAFLLLRATLLLTIDNSEPRYTLEFFPLLFVWIAALFLSPSPSQLSYST